MEWINSKKVVAAVKLASTAFSQMNRINPQSSSIKIVLLVLVVRVRKY
jgi:hypothetical protein